MHRQNLFDAARACIEATAPAAKVALTHELAAAFFAGHVDVGASAAVEPIGLPGRPASPRLVSPRELPRRGLGSVQGRAALVHAVAHIEFNAINLAWDAVFRFRGMPDAYYADWVRVADDEARHFRMLTARLAELGHAYGDFDAHDGLWDMAVRTADSCLERMALVPRVLEARGLDVTPGMIARLGNAGDGETARILERILEEEVAHVAAGSRWFAWCCARLGVEPQATFAGLLERHLGDAVKGPFNVEARRQAGFSVGELVHLGALAA